MPGVRQPVRMTGMGRIVPPHDAHALAQALIEILDASEDYRSGGPAATRRFSSPVIAEEYEQLFNQVLCASQKASAAQPAEKGQL